MPGTLEVRFVLLLALALPHASTAGLLDVNPGAAFEGSLGLEITVQECTASATLNLSGALAGAYEACDSIVAGNATVNSNVTFRSTTIALQSGFSVAAPATFSARTEPFFGVPFAWLREDSPSSETRYHAVLRHRLDGLTLGGADQVDHLVAYSSAGVEWFRLVITYDVASSQKRLLVVARDDSGAAIDSAGAELVLPNGWNRLEISWLAGPGDGFLEVSVNGSPLAAPTPGLASLDNDTGRIDYVRWGAVSGSVTGASGSFHCDGFSSW